MKTKKDILTTLPYSKLDKLIEIKPTIELQNTHDGDVQTQIYRIKFKNNKKSLKIRFTLVRSKKLAIISSTNIKSTERRQEVYIDSNIFVKEGNTTIINLDNLELLIKRFILERVNEIYVNEKEYPLASINTLSSSDSKKSRSRKNDNS